MKNLLNGIIVILLLAFAMSSHGELSDTDDAYDPALDKAFDDDFAPAFDDRPVFGYRDHPVWFKDSFLELEDDLDTALRYGKKGLIVYFGQTDCPYCKALMERDFGKREIAHYTRRNFDVLAIDIHGDKSVLDFDGIEYTERSFSEKLGVNFTPTLIFYDETGKQAFRLNGYQPPYQFQAVLEYVADGHHKEESLHDYLARGEQGVDFDEGALNEADFFSPPPYSFDRSRFAASKPLALFFEESQCHACDVLHSNALTDEEVLKLMEGFDSAQLDIQQTDPVLTPRGQRTTAKEWARELGLFYSPTIIFFDVHGDEIIRVDSVIGFRRMRGVLSYVRSGAYRGGITFQQYRREQRAERLRSRNLLN